MTHNRRIFRISLLKREEGVFQPLVPSWLSFIHLRMLRSPTGALTRASKRLTVPNFVQHHHSARGFSSSSVWEKQRLVILGSVSCNRLPTWIYGNTNPGLAVGLGRLSSFEKSWQESLRCYSQWVSPLPTCLNSDLSKLQVAPNPWELNPPSFFLAFFLSFWSVSPSSHFAFTPLLAGAAVGTIEYDCAIEPVRAYNNINYYQAWADKIDLKRQKIECMPAIGNDPSTTTTASGNQESKNLPGTGKSFEISYDKLVISVGCYSQTFNTPGVKEFATFLKETKVRENLSSSCFLILHWKKGEQKLTKVLESDSGRT